MKRPVFALSIILSATALMAGCPSEDSGSFELTPFRDKWRTVHDGDFPYIDSEGNPQITDIQIGGLISQDNFENRGDVIVMMDGPTDQIKIEMRRFTMAPNEDVAQEDYDAMTLWAYSTNVSSPRKPDDMDEMDDCTNSWQNGCGIRVYYDGQSQLARAGTDLRVTLPANYRHAVDVVTNDNDLDGDYHNRGNVCIQNLNASADVDIGNGLLYVSLANDITPMPVCSAANIETCAGWPDGSGSEAWASECPCIATIGEFGQVRIDSLDATSADITVDIPSNLWVSLTAENQGEGQSVSAEHCESSVGVPGFLLDENLYPNGEQDQAMAPWKIKGFLNHPSEAAVVGAGYSIQAFSSDCAPVSFTEDPEDFVGRNMGADQDIDELRGDIEVCTDCIRNMSCDDLLPGG